MRGSGGTVYRGSNPSGYSASHTWYLGWIHEAIDKYVPDVGGLEETLVVPIVRRWAHAAPHSSASLTTEMMSALAAYVVWCFGVGRDLSSDESMLDVDVYERWIAVGCGHLSEGTKGNYRSAVRRVFKAVRGFDPGPTRQRIGAADVAAPYHRDLEVPKVERWPLGLSCQSRKDDGRTLVSACLGLGVGTEDLLILRGQDLHVLPDGTVIAALRGRRPREVVCRPRYQDWLAEAADRVGPDQFVFRPGRRVVNKNGVTKFTSAAGRPVGCPEISSQRARNTWIVHHLNAGTRLKVLLYASGIESIEGLARYQRFMDDPDRDTWFASMRAAG